MTRRSSSVGRHEQKVTRNEATDPAAAHSKPLMVAKHHDDHENDEGQHVEQFYATAQQMITPVFFALVASVLAYATIALTNPFDSFRVFSLFLGICCCFFLSKIAIETHQVIEWLLFLFSLSACG